MTEQLAIGDLTGDEVIAVPPESTLVAVSNALVGADIGAVVVGTADDVQGIVSERDVVRAVANGIDLATTPASAVSSTRLVWAETSASINDVAGQMMEQWVRHVLIERDGALVGIVSARDVLGALTDLAHS